MSDVLRPSRRHLLIGAAATTAVLATTAAPASADDRGNRKPARPLVIGHRGASGYRPEHTLASYELAARMGADFIEPDLCLTKDGVLVARHEPEIGGTTDVASRPEFADRRKTLILDGVSVTGWWTIDFTLAELKTLRAIERLPQLRQENTVFDGLFEVPTFEEVLKLRARLSRELGREIGVYPETKHPTWFKDFGLDFAPPLVKLLERYDLAGRRSPVFVQSFEITNLIELRKQYKLKAPLVFLLSAAGAPFDLLSSGDPRDYAYFTTAAGLAELAMTVNGIGPDKNMIIPRRADNTLGTPTTLVSDAHAAGLLLHPYTFRAENNFLPADLRNGTVLSDYGKIIDEIGRFLQAGVDGLFTDNPDIGLVARDVAGF